MRLGATQNPLDASFTIPGIGLVITVRGLLKTLCAAASVDDRICRLINQKPEEACKTLVGYGDRWLHDRIEDAFEVMIAQVLEAVDCQKKNWKQMVVDSLSISFSNEGIAIEIDESAILQNVICAIARRTISLSLEQPINLAVRKLKEACAKLSTAKPATTTAPSSTTATSIMDQVHALYARAEAAAAIAKPVATGTKAPPPGSSKNKTAPSVWGALGLTAVAGGFLWFFAKKRRR